MLEDRRTFSVGVSQTDTEDEFMATFPCRLLDFDDSSKQQRANKCVTPGVAKCTCRSDVGMRSPKYRY